MPTDIKLETADIYSDKKYSLKKVSFVRQKEKGGEQAKEAVVFNPGNAATVLFYNSEKRTVILIKQFRLPTYLNENTSGMLIETCAGKMDKGESAEACIRREAEEETGYQIHSINKLFQAYMSAGSVTELMHFFTAEYTEESRISEGGGLEDEQESIDILETDFDKAFAMIGSGEIQDAKTIILLQYAQKHYFAY